MENLSCQPPTMNWESQDLEAAWKRFITHANFVFEGPLKQREEAEKCAYLMIWVGEKGRTIYETWGLSEDQKKVLKNYTDKFEAYVKPKTNLVYNRYKFQSRIQAEGELFEQFVTDLQTLVRDCAYDKPDEMVRDRIVFGVRSNKIREKLICVGSELTYQKTMDIAKSYEITKQQTSKMNISDTSVHAVKSTKPKNVGPKPKTERHSEMKEECSRCGRYHSAKDKCPAIGQICKSCGKKDHYAKKCRSKLRKPHRQRARVHQVNVDNDSEDSDSDAFYVGMIIELSGEKYKVNQLTNSWLLETDINSKKVIMQLDTGARCNVMSTKTLSSLGLKVTNKSNSVLRSYSGHQLKPVGETSVPVKVKDKVHDIKFQIVDQTAETIIGAETCEKLQLVKRIHSVTETKSINDILSKYPKIFNGLGCMPGKHHINIDKEIEPVIHPPRKVPVALKEKVKNELMSMQKQGVIVKQNDPTEWVNSMVTVMKPNGKIRICMDPKDLNKAIKREHHPLKTIEEILPQMSDAKVFTKLDATSGFWQCELDDESKKLCTFNTPHGRFSFTRLPYGIKSASEVYQKIVSEMLNDLDGCESIIDDILIWGKDNNEHDARLDAVLKRISENNLKLNKDKCVFRQSKVTYMGHTLSDKGLYPDPEKIRAVTDMKKPENTKELQTFLGFINYLAKFISNLSQKTEPLRTLLVQNTEWHWEESQEKAFQCLKQAVSEAPVLRYYDPKMPLTLSVDASSKGIGAVLLQNNQPVAYGSRALTQAQQNYAQIEKEALAISYGCTKFHQYVYGRSVRVESDHKPLQAIFKKQLHQAPHRLQRILLTLQKYDLTVEYRPGQEMYISDCLSRAFLNETTEDLNSEELCINFMSYLPVSDIKLKQFQTETRKDLTLCCLKETVEQGWPKNKEAISSLILPYWNFRDEITVADGILFKSHKVIVPNSMRVEMLDIIHEAHLGMLKCKSRAREALFWPGMARDIELKVAKCEVCAENANRNPKEKLLQTEISNRPWSKISVDLFHFKGHDYLLSVDKYSNWPEIAKLDDLSSDNTIMYMKSQFSRYGIPDEVYSDNGPQFSSHSFAKFSKDYGFEHITSSPIYPQSNGHAERGVQTIKNLLRKATDPYKAIMIYRDTIIEGLDKSPAQMFLGRRLKTLLPTTAPLLQQKDSVEIVQKRLKLQERQKYNFDKHATTEQSNLKPGEQVVMKRSDDSRWEPATIVEKHSTPRSYTVQNHNNNKVYRRNRKHLKPSSAKFTPREEPEPEITMTNIMEPAASPIISEDDPRPLPTPPPPGPIMTRSGRTVKLPEKFSSYIVSK